MTAEGYPSSARGRLDPPASQREVLDRPYSCRVVQSQLTRRRAHWPRNAGRILWGTLAFMAGSAILIVVISKGYLLPALDAAKNAAPAERKALAAHARLLLAVVLFILIAGILLTFRFGRFFFPRQRDGEARKPTQYVDAWAESARRMETPPADRD